MDSLVYSWDKPLEEFTGGTFSATNPAPVTFAPGYSYTSPFPDTAQGINNVAALLDPVTGEINYTSFIQGNYDAVVKVSCYRNGQKIAEVYRDFQHVLLPCGISNLPPVVVAPFNSASSFDTTIIAGSPVSFNLLANDNGIIPGTSPTPQSVAIFASGEQFDSTSFSSTSVNCNNPPCAGLSTFPGSYSLTTANLQFNWQTSCDNLKNPSGEYMSSRTYTFLFSAQ
ncbi:MAG: hypothetical protein ABUL44_04580, partial [Flavobacterium sp.]